MAAGPAAPAEELCGFELPAAPGLSLLDAGVLPGDLPGSAGVALATALRASGTTVVDAGRADHPAIEALVQGADISVIVIRPCYLALRRALAARAITPRAAGVVVVKEPGRALGTADITDVLGLPVLCEVPLRSAIARAVDAGVLAPRAPAELAEAADVLRQALLSRQAGRAA